MCPSTFSSRGNDARWEEQQVAVPHPAARRPPAGPRKDAISSYPFAFPTARSGTVLTWVDSMSHRLELNDLEWPRSSS